MTSTQSSHDDAVAIETGFHSLLLEHLSTYSLVDYACKTAQSCYTRVKSSNRVLQYGFETAESLTRAALPLVKTAEPLLARADEFSLRQLERLEGTLAKPYQTIIQLPYVLLDKTLDVGEGTLEYWLPVEDEKKQLKDLKNDEDDKTLQHRQTRAFNILDAFQLRAKERLYSVPIVSRSVDFVSARTKDATALAKRAATLPGTVQLYYSKRKDELVSGVSSLNLQLRQTIRTAIDRILELLHSTKLRFDQLRSLTLQELAVGLVNRLHDLAQALYNRLFPANSQSRERISKVVTHLNEINPLNKKGQAPAAQPEKEEALKKPPRKEEAATREGARQNKRGSAGRRGRGKQINDEKDLGN